MSMLSDDQKVHSSIMREFLLFLNSKSNGFVLKGGTALMFFYGLTRFSEDLDFDGTDGEFFKYVDAFCSTKKLQYRVAKDTDTVKRAMVHYGGSKPLKVEVSYRRKAINGDVRRVDNCLVYSISDILSMKINAYVQRDKIRDLFDISFIYKVYSRELPQSLLSQLADAIAYKGLEQFDFVIKDQTDPLIDNNQLASDFLDMYYGLDLQ